MKMESPQNISKSTKTWVPPKLMDIITQKSYKEAQGNSGGAQVTICHALNQSATYGRGTGKHCDGSIKL